MKKALIVVFLLVACGIANSAPDLQAELKKQQFKIDNLVAKIAADSMYMKTLEDSFTVRVGEYKSRLNHIQKIVDSLKALSPAVVVATQPEVLSDVDPTTLLYIAANPDTLKYSSIVPENHFAAPLTIEIFEGRRSVTKRKYIIDSNTLLADGILLKKGSTYTVKRWLNYGSKQVEIGDYIIDIPNSNMHFFRYVFNDMQPIIIHNQSSYKLIRWRLSSGESGVNIPSGSFAEARLHPDGGILSFDYISNNSIQTSNIRIEDSMIDDIPNDTKYIGPDGIARVVGYIYHITDSDF